MILGKLPFEEIDKAYKAYRFGINMNTIKQSQSMFARRVFELLASNTVVVSNFSRGMRLLFGDLVVSSDDKNQLSTMLEKYCTDELSYKKLRLLGLRKVMQEHTYAERLSFVVSKVFGVSFDNTTQRVLLFAIVNSSSDYLSVVESFEKQTYSNKTLCIVKNFKENIDIKENIYIFDKTKDMISEILSIDSDNTFFGQLNPNDYYGENYLTDMVLSIQYIDVDAFGKGAYYEFSSKIELKNDTKQYLKTNKLEIISSLVKINKLDKSLLERFIRGDIQVSFESMFSIDEFNYCKNGLKASKKELEQYIDDLKLINQGVSLKNNLLKIADTFPATFSKLKDTSLLPTVNAEYLYKLFPTPASTKVKLSFSNSKLQIDTKLGKGLHTYIYAKKQFTREELNLVLNSQFELHGDYDVEDIRTVFEFQDKDGQKISHSMNKAGEHHALAIPNECKYIRFGLKLVGNGRVKISKLVLGAHGETPFAIIGKSKKLVLTKQYPSYDDIYKYGFLHSRIRAYKYESVLVDIFRVNNQPQSPYREFENIDIVTGDNELLEQTLKTGQYDHVLVHLIDQNMWKVLEKFIDKIKVTVWVHGAEIQVWQQRDFEFANMDNREIDRQKRLSNDRVKFWNHLVSAKYENLHFVFVSDWLLKSSEEFLKLKFISKTYSIIHNNIDPYIFDYKEKSKSDRLRILSIRPYAKRVYANDLMVKAIEILSKKDYFNELKFTIVGEGELWNEIISPLKNYSNIILINKFLQHSEISQYHKRNGILLVPTRMDTQGVSRDEAMSSGLVPITTNITAIPEFVDDTCGIIVEPENPQALAEAIEFLYKNPEIFLKLSFAASQRVKNQCGFEKTIQREIDLL
ncbi:MAG: glycosyltransferase, partial [Campylobacteraceae bacterium]